MELLRTVTFNKWTSRVAHAPLANDRLIAGHFFFFSNPPFPFPAPGPVRRMEIPSILLSSVSPPVSNLEPSDISAEEEDVWIGIACPEAR
ncbi:hypothetical protein CEXT_39321 [Caerostris extrusa]|uniref:Uncharacterized protein n=1 Tax=Caerostris extrusa TaxID=172846 RepID=A0AAV4UUE9_CAEEX|nr:hypothetical protein CEXT_39321 [Caerostris extrusa]